MSDRVRNRFVLVFVIGLVLVSLLITVGIPGAVKARKTHLGLDLQGGIELIFQARPAGNTPVNATTIAQAISIIRSRIDQLGVSEPLITASGKDQIDVSLPNAKNVSEAEHVVGVTGQLYFYDWEQSVLTGPGGQVAGATNTTATGDGTLPGQAGYPSEYQAVLLGEAQKPHHYNPTSTPNPSYFYVLPKKKTVVAGPEQAATQAQAKGYLLADLAQHNRKLPAGAVLVSVPAGTVLVQASSDPQTGIPDAYYVLVDKPFITGKHISNPQATTDPTQN